MDPRVRQALRTETLSELWIVIQDAASRQGADRLDLPLTVLDSHAIANGWTATVYNNTMAPHKADMILSCARSIAVSGSTLPSS